MADDAYYDYIDEEVREMTDEDDNTKVIGILISGEETSSDSDC